MTENSIKRLRMKAGMTQKQLAAAARTSQQQIQRIESGVQAARFDIAAKISEALKAPLDVVFPKAKAILAKTNQEGTDENRHLFRMRSADAFEEGGIDSSGKKYTFKFRLNNGLTHCHVVSGGERNRLWSAVQHPDPYSFIVYDTPNRRIGLQLDHIAFSHFLFDPAWDRLRNDEEEDNEDERLKVYFAFGGDPEEFDVDPDQADLSAAFEGEAEEEEVQLQSLFFMVDASCEGADVFNFTDVDGETVFLRGRDVSMIEVPLSWVEPELFRAEREGWNEEKAPDEEYPSTTEPE